MELLRVEEEKRVVKLPVKIQERIMCGRFGLLSELLDIRDAKKNYNASAAACICCGRCL